MNVTTLSINHDGDMFLQGSNGFSYRISPYYIGGGAYSASGKFFYRSETSTSQLAKLGKQLGNTCSDIIPSQGGYIPTNAFIVTYVNPAASDSSLINTFQIIFAKDAKGLHFLIFSYKRLDQTPQNAQYYAAMPDSTNITFSSTIFDTNYCNMPGMYAYRIDSNGN